MGKSKYFLIPVALLFSILLSHNAFAEKYLIMLDSSDGMGAEIGGERILYMAVNQVVRLCDTLNPESKIGVMVFGHTSEGCNDAELIFPFDKPDVSKIREELGKLSPSGRRGLIDSIQKALKIVEKERGESTVIFILTCGWDECGGRAYYVEDAFAEKKIDARLVVIAINPDVRDADKLKELASVANGTYHEVENPLELGNLITELARGSKASLQVIMRGGDPDVPNAQLKIYDEKNKIIISQNIQGFYSTNLENGNYDVQLVYKGNDYWYRDIEIKKDRPVQLTFDLDVVFGELQIEILDSNDERMKGSIVVMDDLGQTVFEGKNRSQYTISLPPGTYSAEVTVGAEVEYYDGLEVNEDSVSYYPIVFSTMMGTAEIVVNNEDGIPVNAAIVVEDSEGTRVAESDFSSTFLVRLPPGDYTAIVTTRSDQQQSVPFTVQEGDNITVDVEVEAPIGSLYVRLVTSQGDAVYGRIRVFDERGREVPYFEREAIEDSEFTFDLPVGTYRIEAQVEGVTRTVEGVAVQEGEERLVEIKFPDELA